MKSVLQYFLVNSIGCLMDQPLLKEGVLYLSSLTRSRYHAGHLECLYPAIGKSFQTFKTIARTRSVFLLTIDVHVFNTN